MASFSKVCFFFENRDFTLEKRTTLKKFIKSMFRKEKKKLESLNYIFVSDKRLLEINRRFLQHNYYTDIITFNLSDSDSVWAEVYISVDRVRENAKKLDVSFKSELHRVIFHGTLHLCGYKDKSKREIEKMREKEDFYLYQYFMQSST
jgi:rRNA maturation RNase YbeY